MPDNCENQNPNYLRDPRLTNLENENRSLKEELKRQKAKTKFYKTKYKQFKGHAEKQNPVQNWASNHGPKNMTCDSIKKTQRSNSVCGAVSPYIQKDLAKKMGPLKAKPVRNSAVTVTRKQTMTDKQEPGTAVSQNRAATGQLHFQTNQGLASTSRQEKLKSGRDGVSAIALNRKIFNLERLITK